MHFPGNGIARTSHAPSALPAQSSLHEGQPPLVKVASNVISEGPKWAHQEYSSFTEPQAHKVLSVTELCPIDTGKPEHLRPVGMGEQGFSQSENSADGDVVRAWSEGAYNFQNSCQLQHNGQFSGSSRISSQQSGLDSLGPSACTKENKKQKVMEGEDQNSFGASSKDGCQGKRDSKLNESERTHNEKGHQTLTEKIRSNSRHTLAWNDRHYLSKDLSSLQSKLDENILPCGISTPKTSGKLWDGSLQLNSSIIVSAVAFYKSGERLLDISWSRSVEVKGKVRFEAFEKYIQDLPRSRTRGLMVISLCAKDGCSDKEMKSMKEVAKAYRKGERVGFAKLSPVVDLYLCPRTWKIFKILTKYGFFKGMAAAEDKSESLIGCVVWRKNQIPEGSVTEEKDGNSSLSKHHRNAPSDSSIQNVGERSMPSTPGIQKNVGERSMPSTPGIQKFLSSSVRHSFAVDSVIITDKKAEIGNSSGGNLASTPIPVKSSIPVEQRKSGHFNLSSQTSKAHTFNREASSLCSSQLDQSKASSDLPQKLISLPSNVVKHRILAAEDDDLPDYDFGTACGISFTSLSIPTDVLTADTWLRTERVKNVDGQIPPALPVIQSISFFNSQSDNFSSPKHFSSMNRGMPQPGSTVDPKDRMCIPGIVEDQHNLQKYATPTPVSTSTFASPKVYSDKLHKRNLFSYDDDYDIPEWLPPHHQVPTLAERMKTSGAIPSGSSSSTFQGQLGCQRPPHSPPSPASTRPEFAYIGIPQFHHQSTYTRGQQSLPIQNGPGSLTGFHYNEVLKPPSGLL